MTGLRRRHRERLLLSTSRRRGRNDRPRRRSIRGGSYTNGRLIPFLVEAMLGSREQADECCREEEEQDGEGRQDLFEEGETSRGAGERVAGVVGEVRLIIFWIHQQRCRFCDKGQPGSQDLTYAHTLIGRVSCRRHDGVEEGNQAISNELTTYLSFG